jgi:hypothetical protein
MRVRYFIMMVNLTYWSKICSTVAVDGLMHSAGHGDLDDKYVSYITDLVALEPLVSIRSGAALSRPELPVVAA